MEGAVVAHIKDYKGKRDIIILRFRNAMQLLLDAGNEQENLVWRDQFKSALEMITDYKAEKLIKEREGSIKWLLKIKEKYGVMTGAPVSPEGAIAIRQVEEEIAEIDKKIQEIKEKTKAKQDSFQEAASKSVNTIYYFCMYFSDARYNM